MEPTDGMQAAADAITNVSDATLGDVTHYIQKYIGPEIEALQQQVKQRKAEATACIELAISGEVKETYGSVVEMQIGLLNKQLASVTAERDAARAEAAAMREAIEKARAVLNINNQGTRCKAGNILLDATSGTAGRELLDELQRLRELIKRVDAACTAALTNDPEGPRNAEDAGAEQMAVDILNIIRDQTASKVSK